MNPASALLWLLLPFLPTAVQAQAPIPGRPVIPPPQVSVVDESLQSASLGRPMRYRVILPAGYEPSSRRYPSLYLLHGLTGAYSDWEGKTHLTEYATRYDLIIVTPDANDSWYTNSSGQPSEKYEDYIMKDLVAEVDKRFRTISSRHARAVAGLSMGGYGALKIGIKYPQFFVFAASFSGALNVARDPDFLSTRPGKYRDGVVTIFGAAGSQTRAENDVYALAKKADPAELPFIYLDCGTEDGLLKPNREFADLLQQKKIPYEYRELPGTHEWSYWDRQLPEMLRVLARRMAIAARGGQF